MTAPGKLVAIEGIDGSGKRTQVDLLTLKPSRLAAIPCIPPAFLNMIPGSAKWSANS